MAFQEEHYDAAQLRVELWLRDCARHGEQVSLPPKSKEMLVVSMADLIAEVPTFRE